MFSSIYHYRNGKTLTTNIQLQQKQKKEKKNTWQEIHQNVNSDYFWEVRSWGFKSAPLFLVQLQFLILLQKPCIIWEVFKHQHKKVE